MSLSSGGKTVAIGSHLNDGGTGRGWGHVGHVRVFNIDPTASLARD